MKVFYQKLCYFLLGLAALTKVVISIETGIIPANLHYNQPNPDIKALTNGSIQVASLHTPLTGSFMLPSTRSALEVRMCMLCCECQRK